jgi:beta-lactamase class A
LAQTLHAEAASRYARDDLRTPPPGDRDLPAQKPTDWIARSRVETAPLSRGDNSSRKSWIWLWSTLTRGRGLCPIGMPSATSVFASRRVQSDSSSMVKTRQNRKNPRFRLAGLMVTVLGSVSQATTGCTAADHIGSAGRAEPSTRPTASISNACRTARASLSTKLFELERDRGGRVGLHAIDTGDGDVLGYRSDERFALASTVKALAAGVVLQELDRDGLFRRIRWDESDLVPHSPVTERHTAVGLTVREVMRAAITMSDNIAGNLLMDLVGGPAALDRRLEEAGDRTTTVARREPGLNDYKPGDERDTTTPAAIADTLNRYAIGGQLPASERRLLNRMLEENTTGDALIRAAVPATWKVGDKTGSASYGARNDIAILRPPGRAPVVLAILTRQQTADAAPDDVLVAEAARLAVRALC